jgi:drug/metabolite transporter (DMT)-like permease
VAIMLALGAAAFYGSADFMGGLAARRSSALTAAFGAQVAGLVVLVAGLVALGPAAPTGADLGLGALSGVFGGLGLVGLYRALARGPMSVVAPVSALSAASVPVLAGLGLGERPGPSALVGIGVALVAVVLITWERTEPGVPGTRVLEGRVLATALAGGALFGLFFVAQHQATETAGLWPLLAARFASIPILAALLLRERVAVGFDRRLVASVLVGGTLDMLANIFFVMATRHGMLAVVAALTGLYPASTVLLAQTRLGERLHGVQTLGLGVAGLAAVLVAV